jgi:hypothetical protein
MIRDGDQDFSYLRRATAAGHAAEVRQIARKVYPAAYNTVTTDQVIENARTQLAQLIASGQP